MVALQHRRVGSTEPEDEAFTFRWWGDLQFLIISLGRLRTAAKLAAKPALSRDAMKTAISVFDAAVPDLQRMRNVGEHFDQYAVEAGHDRSVSRRYLQAGAFDGTTLLWLSGSLSIDDALVASEQLYAALKEAGEGFRQT